MQVKIQFESEGDSEGEDQGFDSKDIYEDVTPQPIFEGSQNINKFQQGQSVRWNLQKHQGNSLDLQRDEDIDDNESVHSLRFEQDDSAEAMKDLESQLRKLQKPENSEISSNIPLKFSQLAMKEMDETEQTVRMKDDSAELLKSPQWSKQLPPILESAPKPAFPDQFVRPVRNAQIGRPILLKPAIKQSSESAFKEKAAADTKQMPRSVFEASPSNVQVSFTDSFSSETRNIPKSAFGADLSSATKATPVSAFKQREIVPEEDSEEENLGNDDEDAESHDSKSNRPQFTSINNLIKSPFGDLQDSGTQKAKKLPSSIVSPFQSTEPAPAKKSQIAVFFMPPINNDGEEIEEMNEELSDYDEDDLIAQLTRQRWTNWFASRTLA